MTKPMMRMAALMVGAVLALSLASCGGAETASESSSKPKVIYKCLSSSCDATTACGEGDPIPQHCGKPMIR